MLRESHEIVNVQMSSLLVSSVGHPYSLEGFRCTGGALMLSDIPTAWRAFGRAVEWSPSACANSPKTRTHTCLSVVGFWERLTAGSSLGVDGGTGLRVHGSVKSSILLLNQYTSMTIAVGASACPTIHPLNTALLRTSMLLQHRRC